MKFLKAIFINSVVFALAISCLIQSNALTTFTENGIVFLQLNDNTVSVYDYEGIESDIKIPNKSVGGYVISVEDFALQQNKKVLSIDFSKAVHLSTIGKMSFNECSSLSGKLLLPYYINNIGIGAFQNCSSVTELDYMARTKNISEQCFNRCTSLESVKISSGVETIEKLAFANCESLASITIPSTVNSIDPTAFDGCGEFVIKGYRGSYAQEYAKSKGIDFYILDPLYGDSNADGKVNILDVTAIQKYKIGEQELSEYGMRCADVNHDGSITVRDATLIQMKLAKYDVDF